MLFQVCINKELDNYGLLVNVKEKVPKKVIYLSLNQKVIYTFFGFIKRDGGEIWNLVKSGEQRVNMNNFEQIKA